MTALHEGEVFVSRTAPTAALCFLCSTTGGATRYYARARLDGQSVRVTCSFGKDSERAPAFTFLVRDVKRNTQAEQGRNMFVLRDVSGRERKFRTGTRKSRIEWIEAIKGALYISRTPVKNAEAKHGTENEKLVANAQGAYPPPKSCPPPSPDDMRSSIRIMRLREEIKKPAKRANARSSAELLLARPMRRSSSSRRTARATTDVKKLKKGSDGVLYATRLSVRSALRYENKCVGRIDRLNLTGPYRARLFFPLRLERILFSSKAVRVTRRGKTLDRYVVVSLRAVYVLRGGAISPRGVDAAFVRSLASRRRIASRSVHVAHVARDEIVIGVHCQSGLYIRLERAGELAACLRRVNPAIDVREVPRSTDMKALCLFRDDPRYCWKGEAGK
eukprot:g1296.t1